MADVTWSAVSRASCAISTQGRRDHGIGNLAGQFFAGTSHSRAVQATRIRTRSGRANSSHSVQDWRTATGVLRSTSGAFRRHADPARRRSHGGTHFTRHIPAMSTSMCLRIAVGSTPPVVVVQAGNAGQKR